jgi:hypothetical protein
MLILLKIFLAGIVVLVVAVVLNLVASLLNLVTWYTFLNQVTELGLAASLKSLRAVDYLFLILIYPFLLGLAAYLVFSR